MTPVDYNILLHLPCFLGKKVLTKSVPLLMEIVGRPDKNLQFPSAEIFSQMLKNEFWTVHLDWQESKTRHILMTTLV